ncbi:hypothetical protein METBISCDRAFT_22860 [Metschnikowia bicuspidata]|uniref:Uncharacterized protein n=1 Tax=Metschnikowia bicuspidata TaxID=27322 RepID=A0A4P9ZDG2_9ASCO|nr:hypothetical protein METBISCDRAFT_22860 [Metschnikowia bicuspidata]
MVDKDKDSLGINVFFIWGGCNFLCFLFAFVSIFETKGLVLEQVDELFEKIPYAWKPQNFVPWEQRFQKGCSNYRDEGRLLGRGYFCVDHLIVMYNDIVERCRPVGVTEVVDERKAVRFSLSSVAMCNKCSENHVPV